MREPSFTPGPWDAAWFAKLLRDLHNQPYSDYLADEQRDGFNYPGWTLRNDDADGRLIAAAPALYEALRRVMDTYGFDPSIDSSIWNEAAEALSLALGGSPNA